MSKYGDFKGLSFVRKRDKKMILRFHYDSNVDFLHTDLKLGKCYKRPSHTVISRISDSLTRGRRATVAPQNLTTLDTQ